MRQHTKKSPMTYLEAARAVLEEMKQPMHFKKITELALQKNYLRTRGKTPEWTMGARLSVDVRDKGPESDFVRVDSGRYGLRKWRRGKAPVIRPGTPGRDADDPRYWLVSVEPENFAHDEHGGGFDTIGVKERMRRTMNSLRPYDRVVIFIKKSAEFGAILEVAGEPYSSDSKRWPVLGPDLSARAPCRPAIVLHGEGKLDARPLYTRLEVFKQYPARHRMLALRNGITEISAADYRLIELAFKGK